MRKESKSNEDKKKKNNLFSPGSNFPDFKCLAGDKPALNEN